jgi:hypothetical protein
VIVQLGGDIRLEHELAGPEAIKSSVAVAMQGALIRQCHDRVLADLAGTSVSSTKRFKLVSPMGMSVDGPGQDALVRPPEAPSIHEDRREPPSLYQSADGW